MNRNQGILLFITVCIFIYVIYRFVWKRNMITRIINKLQRKCLACKPRCKNDNCRCNTLESFELFGTAKGEYNSLIENDSTSIVSLPPEHTYLSDKETGKARLKDYIVKSSYNSAVTGKYVNIDMVKYLLRRGVRLLDFEVMLIDNAPMITYTDDKTLGTIESNNTLLLDNVFSMVVSGAFVQPTPNIKDPLFIHLRIKAESGNDNLYKLIAKSIDSTLKGKLYTGQINKDTTMSDIMGKIVIIVDKTINRQYKLASSCGPSEKDCYDLNKYVNLESGSDFLFLHRYSEILNLSYDHVRVEDTCPICTSTTNMRMVLPDTINKNTKNPDIDDFILNYGSQFVLYKFYSKDAELERYEQLFDDNKGGIIPLAYAIDYLAQNTQSTE